MSITTAPTPAAQLASVVDHLCQPRDPRQRQWLVIPGQGRAEWVQRAWAKRAGIAGRSQLLMVRALIELAARGDPDEPRPLFDRQHLAIIIADHITTMPPGLLGALQEKFNNSDEAISAQQLAWAELLAAALDDGLLSRHDITTFAPVLQWLILQPAINEALVGHLGHKASLIFAARHRLAQTLATSPRRRPQLPCCPRHRVADRAAQPLAGALRYPWPRAPAPAYPRASAKLLG